MNEHDESLPSFNFIRVKKQASIRYVVQISDQRFLNTITILPWHRRFYLIARERKKREEKTEREKQINENPWLEWGDWLPVVDLATATTTPSRASSLLGAVKLFYLRLHSVSISLPVCLLITTFSASPLSFPPPPLLRLSTYPSD